MTNTINFPNRPGRARLLTTAENAAATLPRGTIIYNTDDVLVVHDGLTAGGQTIGGSGSGIGTILLLATAPTADPGVPSGTGALAIVYNAQFLGLYFWNGTSWEQLI